MTCSGCKLLDIYKVYEGRDLCYKCIYNLKAEKHVHKKKGICHICNVNQIPQSRTKYCSKECGKIGRIQKDKERWLYKLNAPKCNWITDFKKMPDGRVYNYSMKDYSPIMREFDDQSIKKRQDSMYLSDSINHYTIDNMED